MEQHDCCAAAPVSEHGAAREATSTTGGPLVEILFFDGCPNHHPALALVKRVSGELGIEPDIRLVNVPDAEAAQRMRFLGSPTIRVGGRDVDSSAQERSDYALSCRVYQTDAGVVGQPEERWVRDALLREREGPGKRSESVESELRVAGR